MIRFSVIIPTFNRPNRLTACLGSFLDLDYQENDWELIVVNDGGKRSFSALTDNLTNRLPLTLVEVEHSGPARARNAGANIAQGKFLVFTDDDCRVDPNWLKAYEKCFTDSPAAALEGKTLNPYPGNIPAETWSLYMDFLQKEIMRDQYGHLLLLISNNLAYHRDVFLKIGGFNESFPFAAAEDSELGSRLVGLGYQTATCPEALIWHDHKNTAVGYLRQQFRYGRGNFYFQTISGEPGYPAVERHQSSFIESMKKLLAFARSIEAPRLMKFLLIATPFAFKAGNLYESFQMWGSATQD